jgi:hypothetical protein
VRSLRFSAERSEIILRSKIIMIDETKYHLFSKESHEDLRKKTHNTDIIEQVRKRYVNENKIKVDEYGMMKYGLDVSVPMEKEVKTLFDERKLKLNCETNFGDMIIKKIEEDENPDKCLYRLTVGERICEIQLLEKFKTILVLNPCSRGQHLLVNALDNDNNITETVIKSEDKVAITETLINKIMNMLNENLIIQITIQCDEYGLKYYRNTQIWKDGLNFKEKSTYENNIISLSSLINHYYNTVRIEYEFRLIFKKIFMINSFLDLDEASIIVIMKYLLGDKDDQ